MVLTAIGCPFGATAQILLEPEWEDVFRDESVTLGPIRSMAFTPSGRLAVLDGHTVVTLDMEGREVSRWGGRGEGPEEFSNPVDIAVSADGMFVVADMDGVGVFSAVGELVASYPVEGNAVPLSVEAVVDGEIFTLTMDLVKGVFSVVRLSDGRSIWEAVSPAMVPMSQFVPRPRMASLGERLAVGDGREYRFDVMDAVAEKVVGTISRPIEAREITSSFAGKVRDYLANPGRAPNGWSSVVGNGERRVPAAMLAMLEFPETFPVFGESFPGPNRSLWVRRGLGVGDNLSQPIDPPDAHAVSFDLFDMESLEYRGTVVAPDGFLPVAGDSTRLAGIETGLAPAVRVVRLQFAPTGEG